MGSSSHQFIPDKYFKNKLNMPLSLHGEMGHQTFVMLSQLVALDNKKVRDNAKLVFIISPGWFNNGYEEGTHIDKFLKYIHYLSFP